MDVFVTSFKRFGGVMSRHLKDVFVTSFKRLGEVMSRYSEWHKGFVYYELIMVLSND